MGLEQGIIAAVAVIVFLVLFVNWLIWKDSQRIRQADRDLRIWKGETIVGIALEDIEAYVPVVVSESTTPGEALFMLPDVFNHEGEIDPSKVVYLKNLEEAKR